MADTKHPLRGLLISQFFGALNDNAWKLLVALLAIGKIAPGDHFESQSQAQMTLTFVVLTLPLAFFSLPAGSVADRWSKRSLILWMKALEILLMALGTLALWIDPNHSTLLLIVLGLMGVQSAFFSPAKYGILPEILPHEKLSEGNGALEAWTVAAIIAGTALGGVLLDGFRDRIWICGMILTGFSVLGFLAARFVPKVAPTGSGETSLKTLASAWTALRADRTLWLAALGIVIFWGFASLLSQNLLIYSKSVLGLSDKWASLPLAVMVIGIGAGGVFAGKLSGKKVEYGLVPLGAVGVFLSTLTFGLLLPQGTVLYLLGTLLGLSGGLLLIPLNALLQWRAPEKQRGAVIALTNVFVFSATIAGSLTSYFLSKSGIHTQEIFLVAGAVTALGTLWALKILPDALLRLLLVLATHTFYKLKIIGRENIPEKGGALLIPNHVSFVDGLLVMASLDRRVRFIVDQQYYNLPLVKPIAKSLKFIPIASDRGPRVILRALKDAGKYLDEGRLVCLFPEGEITRTGMLNPFRRGLEKILKGRTTPVIPVHLDRVWGSLFSRSKGKFLFKIPERIPHRVTVSFGKALPADTPMPQLRQAVMELGEKAWEYRKPDRKPLHRSFISSARRRPFRFAFADPQRPKVRRFQSLIGAISLARALKRDWDGQKNVGILLPPSFAGVLVNFSAAMAGKVSVNLNYTAGAQNINSAAKQANLKTVVTARAFLEKAKIDFPEGTRPLWIDEIASRASLGQKFSSALCAIFLPARVIEKICGAKEKISVDDVVTIIFSSGSTGEPKGVLLTHFNIDSNVEALAQAFQTTQKDRMLGILPLFHSFGYTATVWYAANKGMGVAFYPNPVDPVAIGDLVQQYRLTGLLGPPKFLQIYTKRVEPGKFGSLRLVLAGAEKLTDRVAEAFEKKFGLRPLEGYGATECAPGIAVSTPGFRAPGFYQAGSKKGFLGQPLPGVSIRIVDPETFETLPPNTPGMLLVRGPNVMKGYLGQEELTRKSMHGDWYITGDIALHDDDGFIQITDRLSRFSKIGGEMVPHGKVEEALHEAAELEEQKMAVTSVEDEKKGERLIVIHTLEASKIPEILERMKNSGLPALFIPKENQFLRVEALPLLGTGKIDLRQIKKIAKESS